MSQGFEAPTMELTQAPQVSGMFDKIRGFGHEFSIKARMLTAGLVLSSLAIAGCTASNETETSNAAAISTAAETSGDAVEVCSPESIDFTQNVADKAFGATGALFPALAAKAENQPANVKLMRTSVLGDKGLASAMSTIFGVFKGGVAQPEKLTNAGLAENAAAFDTNETYRVSETIEICNQLELATFQEAVAAPVGGQKLTANRDEKGVVSYTLEEYTANTILENVWQLKGNADVQDLTPEQIIAQQNRLIYVTMYGEVIVLGVAYKNEGEAVLTDHGKEVKAAEEAAAEAAASASASASSEAAASASAQAEAEAAAAQAAADKAAADAAAAAAANNGTDTGSNGGNGSDAGTNNGSNGGSNNNSGTNNGGGGSGSGDNRGTGGGTGGGENGNCGGGCNGGGGSGSGSGACSTCGGGGNGGGNGGGSGAGENPNPAPNPAPSTNPNTPPPVTTTTKNTPPPVTTTTSTPPPVTTTTSTPPPVTTATKTIDLCEADPNNPACN